MKNLIIIDGHALAYRSYYAMIKNPLITSSGMNTNAIYGFLGYVSHLLTQFPNDYLVVTFDPPTKSFRSKIYAEYKAHRKPMPDDLRPQIALLHTIVEALGLPCFVVEDMEADDVIGHLARYADSIDMGVKIISKDKDLMQLVNDTVHLFAPESGSRFIDYGPQEVFEKMGVFPERIVDFLALTGDAADNIPGLPGVGPKTAIKILESADTVENLLENPDSAGNPKLADKVRENLDILRLSLQLVCLAETVPLVFHKDSFIRKPVDNQTIKTLFQELEFESYIKNPAFGIKDDYTREDYPFTIIRDMASLQTMIAHIEEKGFVSLDTETTSLEKVEAQLVGISCATSTDMAYYLPLGHTEGENADIESALQLLKPMLENPQIKKIGQNLKYDYQVFRNYDIVLAGISFDTMVAAYLVDPTQRSYSLSTLALTLLDQASIPIEELIGKGKTLRSFAEVSIDDAAIYAIEDVVLPLLLKEILEVELEKSCQKDLFDQIEIPLIPVLAEMEYAGVSLDHTLLTHLSQIYRTECETTADAVFTLAGETFNLNSPKQLSEILFDKMKLPHGKKTTTGYSTGSEVLQELVAHHSIASKILLYREKHKLLSTYIDAFPQKVSKKTGRLHTSFNQTVTTTGRLSSSEPNLQNIPVRTEDGRRVREAFVPREGTVLLAADYSQIELRLLAHFSQDPVLLEAFRQNEDIHEQTASAIYGIMPALVTPEMRRAAKTINFGLMYGMGAHKLSHELHISFGEAKRFIEQYFAQFPTIQKCITTAQEKARQNGYSETIFHRRLPIPGILSTNRQIRENAERVAVNAPVQGTAADIIKLAMIRIHDRIKREALPIEMLLQVHDELVFEVEKDQVDYARELIAQEMTSVVELSVPLVVDIGIGTNWSEAH